MKSAIASDADYLAAVKAGATDWAQQMVDDAAKKAGYEIKVSGFFVKNANKSIGKPPKWADEIYKFGKLASENGRFKTVKEYHLAASYGDAIDPKQGSVTESALRYWDGSDGTLANYIFEQGLKGEEIGPFVFAERIGNAPERGYSLNYRDQTGEQGVSVIGLLDPAKGLVKQNDGTFELFNDGEKRFVGGFLTPYKGSDGEPLLIGIQFDGKRHQIKSADPVTYDKTGSVIPLSKRFNSNSEEITNPVISRDERQAKIEKLKELTATAKKFWDKGGLTRTESEKFRTLMAEANDLRFDLQKPLTVDKIPSETERLSTMPADMVMTAHEDLMRDRKIYTPIVDAAIGVSYNAETAIDQIITGKKANVSAQQFYAAFDSTRAAMRKHYGDTVKLWRASGSQQTKATTNWATTEAFAKQFGGNVISKEIPIDEVIAVNVGFNGKYHEIIVGKKPKRIEEITNPVVPTIDADYLAAVKAGDTTNVQRMVDNAAKKAGLTAMYHGTRNAFESKQIKVPDIKDTGYGLRAIWLTTDAEHARDHYGKLGAEYEDYNELGKSRTLKFFVRESDFGLDLNAIAKRQELEFLESQYQIKDAEKQEGKRWNKILQVAPFQYNDTALELLADEFNYKGIKDERYYAALTPRLLKSADPVTYDKSGNIIPLSKRFNFQSSEITNPARRIPAQFPYEYAKYLKQHFPEIWKLGGNIRGNDAFRWWTAYRQGDRSPTVMRWWTVTRPAWIARHYRDHRIAGVVAQIKWGTIGSLGVAGMKRVIETKIRDAR